MKLRKRIRSNVGKIKETIAIEKERKTRLNY